MADGWYEEVKANARLMQGDLISDCPLIAWKAEELELQPGSDRPFFY